jgi:hypothetical protein
LLFIVSGASFISTKIKEQGFFKKSHKKIPVPLGSGIRDPEKIHTGSRGVKKHRIRIRNTGVESPDPDPVDIDLCRIRVLIRST